jgi:hypothetical protein
MEQEGKQVVDLFVQTPTLRSRPHSSRSTAAVLAIESPAWCWRAQATPSARTPRWVPAAPVAVETCRGWLLRTSVRQRAHQPFQVTRRVM